MSKTELWKQFLDENFCHEIPDIGRPCDLGCPCDKCMYATKKWRNFQLAHGVKEEDLEK